MEKVCKNDLEFYNNNGYLIKENVLSEKDCDHYLNLCLKYLSDEKLKNYPEIPQVHRKIPEVLEIMKNINVLSIVEKILKGKSVGLQTVCSFKKANTPSGNLAWNPHQDGTYINIDEKKYVSGDIALDHHKTNSGLLYVYPGSHKEKILEYEPFESFGKLSNNPGNRVKDIPKKYKATELKLRKGSMLSFHSNVIHGSTKNTTKNGWRPLFLMAFMKEGSNYNPGKIAKREPIELR